MTECVKKEVYEISYLKFLLSNTPSSGRQIDINSDQMRTLPVYIYIDIYIEREEDRKKKKHMHTDICTYVFIQTHMYWRDATLEQSLTSCEFGVFLVLDSFPY